MNLIVSEPEPLSKFSAYYGRRLPVDIIINHILPYAYMVQPKVLLLDIRSFYIDYELIQNTYYTMYNGNILLYDLRKFMEGSPRSRNFVTRNNSISREYCEKVNSMLKHRHKSKYIFGSFTRQERTSFINQYILESDV